MNLKLKTCTRIKILNLFTEKWAVPPKHLPSCLLFVHGCLSKRIPEDRLHKSLAAMQQPQAGTPGQGPGYPGQQPGTPGQQLGYPGMPPGYPGSPKNPMSEAVYLSQPGTHPGAFAAPRRTCAWHALSTSCRPAYLRVGFLLLAAAACGRHRHDTLARDAFTL
jgi:hypothetical protein